MPQKAPGELKAELMKLLDQIEGFKTQLLLGFANLTACQVRCNEMSEENKKLKAKLRAMTAAVGQLREQLRKARGDEERMSK